MKRPRAIIGTLCAILLLLGAWLVHDYFTSLRILQAGIVRIMDDPAQPSRKVLVVAVFSDFPPWPWVPAPVRRFFRLQPQLCLRHADGTELINDDLGESVFSEENHADKKSKPHSMEQSEFQIPIHLVATPFNGKRVFFHSLVQQHGTWANLRLAGYWVPPAVESKPFFLDLRPYCASHAAQCSAGFGWSQ